jgi:hypothetical protein
MAAWLEELSGYPAESLVIGIDLGDRRSTFCIRRRKVQAAVQAGLPGRRVAPSGV